MILVLNCGSSSIKFCIFKEDATVLSGLVENIGQQEVVLSYQQGEIKNKKILGAIDYQTAFQYIFPLVRAQLTQPLRAIGHRVVHGGKIFTQSVAIDSQVLAQIKACIPLAPLHNPANLLGIEAAGIAFPKLPQVAVFDTAFHHSLPEHAYLYALPNDYYRQHDVRRYGFHGISYQYLIPKAAEILGLPLEKTAFIAAHLGNGCSVCAALGGKSVDVSMGLTPLEGLMMGTRAGDLDPGLFEYLTQALACSVKALTKILNKHSGLLGVSGLSNDMRALIEAADHGNMQAKLALEMFCYRLAKYIAAYMVPLGRLDALIFSGGIGENAAWIREKTLSLLKFLNFHVDVEQNKVHGVQHNGCITTKASTPALVIKTQEEWMIAKETSKLWSAHYC